MRFGLFGSAQTDTSDLRRFARELMPEVSWPQADPAVSGGQVDREGVFGYTLYIRRSWINESPDCTMG